MEQFGALLRRKRLAAGLTRPELAARARVSVDAIASWEGNRRKPNRDTVIVLARALDLPPGEGNELLAALDYETLPDEGMQPFLARRRPLRELQEECATYRWPCLVIAQDWEVVGWNEAANVMSELDFAVDLDGPGERQLLHMALSEHFLKRLVSWDETMGLLMAMFKNEHIDPSRPDNAGPALATLVSYVAEHHPQLFGRLLKLWNETEPWHDGVRVALPVDWRTGDGTDLRFDCVFTAWSDFDGAWAFDWHPANAATWNWLEAHRGPVARTSGPATSTPHSLAPADDWRALLRRSREAAGLSREELAARSHFSSRTIEAYERGNRDATRETLAGLCDAIGPDVATKNAVLAAAGFAPAPSDWANFLTGKSSGRYTGDRDIVHVEAPGIQTAIDTCAWPVLVVNGRCEVVCANPALERLFGIDVEATPPGVQRNLVCLVTDLPFRSRVLDWASTVSQILPGEFEPLLNGGGKGKDAAYFAAVAAHVVRRERQAHRPEEPIQELVRMWQSRPSRRLAVRVAFEMQMREGRKTLRFNTVVSPWNTFDPFWAIELHPADAATWEALSGSAVRAPAR